MQRSPIEWTDFTANPLRYRDPDGNVVHACIHKSGGCLHCYAETLAGRWGRAGKKFTAENMKRLTPFLDEKELHQMLAHKPASGKRCFVGDMTDIFGEWVPFELIDQLFAAFALRPDVTFQILTKRPERMREYCVLLAKKQSGVRADECPSLHGAFPDYFPNVWLGVSVEDQKTADERIPLLLQTPAAVRFVSYEPALGPVDFTRLKDGTFNALDGIDFEDIGDIRDAGIPSRQPAGLDWIIVGGESGPGARPMHPDWARSVRDQCQAADIAYFFKQWGGVNKKTAGRLLDGQEWNEFPKEAAR